MGYETLIISKCTGGVQVLFNRAQQRNSINAVMMDELNRVLNETELDPDCRIIVISGRNGIFCTGLDFGQAQIAEGSESGNCQHTAYMNILKRLARSPKVIISVIDGQVLAGGVGIAAASDLVIATARSSFCLSEAIWGLLPACVIPFLIRRIGFQKAYWMTLTTHKLSADQAKDIHLVDELSDNLDNSVRLTYLKIRRLQEQTIMNIKTYFRKMWFLSEKMEHEAVNEISRLLSDPAVIANLQNYHSEQKFPWEA